MTAALFGTIVYLALGDTSFNKPQVHTSLTANANAHLQIDMYFCLIVIVICTSLADYALILINKKKRER